MLRAISCAVFAALAGCSALPPVVEAPAPSRAAAWMPQQHAASTELRGLSVLSDEVAWASGAKGTVLRTVDGEHWTLLTVPGAEAFDFRDIEAFDANTAIVMGAGPGAASRIYRTRDGGASWQLLVVNKDAEGFWDAMAFWDSRNGIVFGDPVRGAFQILVTSDGGESWQPVSDPGGLAALPQEGAFAASGTCLSVGGRADAWFVTGGEPNHGCSARSTEDKAGRPRRCRFRLLRLARAPSRSGLPATGAASLQEATTRSHRWKR